MKPSFALNLSHDGISLLHRAQAGWLNVGDVSLDAPDLMDELVVLRRTAADLETESMTTKLVIPDSQILYLEVDAPGPTRADRVAQIRDALVGLTPYDLSDLVFDWRSRGKKAQVAVVARETLTEAESFAMQYRFNPVSFVATPRNGSFEGEPFFGPTRHAVRLLEGGETIEPDKRRIKIVGRLGEMKDAGEIGKPANGATAPKQAKDPAPTSDAAPDGADREAVPAPNGVAFSHRRTETPPLTRPAASPKAPETSGSVAFSSRRQRGGTESEGDTSQHSAGAETRPASPGAEEKSAAGATEKATAARIEELPPLPPRPETDTEAGAKASPPLSRLNGAAVTTPRARPDAAPAGSSPAARAAAVEPTAPELAKKADPVLDLAAGRAAVEPPATPPKRDWRSVFRGRKGTDPDEPHANLSETLDRIRRSPIPESAGTQRAEAPAAPVGSPSGEKGLSIPSRRAKETTSKSRQLARRAPPLPAPKLKPLPKVQIKARGEMPALPPQPKPAQMPPRAETPRPVTATEADAMTVFGARGKTPPKPRPPFVGPALTLAALLALAVVGLWSTYFLSDVARDWFGLGTEPEVAEAEEPAPVILPEPGSPSVEDGPIGNVDAAALPPETAPDTATPDAAPSAGDAPVLPSVPLPGIEVTAIQPEPSATAPDAPVAPDEDVAAGAPANETALPPALTEEGSATPPELAAASPPEESTAPDLTIASAEPPAAPDLPPVVDVSPPVVDTSPPDAEPSPVAPDPLDPGPAPDIATVAPRPPSTGVDVASGTGAPSPADDNPGEIDLVRLEAPPTAGSVPEIGVEAPPPAVPTRIAPPTAEEALAFYETTGISVLAPASMPSPGTDRLSDMVLSSVDVSLSEPRLRSLPTAEELGPGPSPVPRTTLPPLPLTLEFDLDDRGLVRATEEGAVTPQGVVVFRGTPSVVPPARPGRPEVEEESRAPDTPEVLGEPEGVTDSDTAVAGAPDAESAPDEEEMAAVDPDVFRDVPFLDEEELAEVGERARYGGRTRAELAEIRPTLRPGTDLASADSEAPEVEVAGADAPDPAGEDATAGGVTLVALETGSDASDDAEAGPAGAGSLVDVARFVPPLRPGTNVPEAEPSEAETAQGPETDPGEVPESEAAFDDATELAVNASLTPPTRPAGFGSIVQAALEEAASAPSPPPAAERTPTPETVAVRAPDIPSSATVASTATEENALRLSRVNLIGVYGSAANRRALVRLSSGRYVKVQVGDRVDGGRVAAIGDNELRYVKGGRTLTLSLPNG